MWHFSTFASLIITATPHSRYSPILTSQVGNLAQEGYFMCSRSKSSKWDLSPGILSTQVILFNHYASGIAKKTGAKKQTENKQPNLPTPLIPHFNLFSNDLDHKVANKPHYSPSALHRVTS